jgi:hypothetical protein
MSRRRVLSDSNGSRAADCRQDRESNHMAGLLLLISAGVDQEPGQLRLASGGMRCLQQTSTYRRPQSKKLRFVLFNLAVRSHCLPSLRPSISNETSLVVATSPVRERLAHLWNSKARNGLWCRLSGSNLRRCRSARSRSRAGANYVKGLVAHFLLF